jgi:type I restriction enzyme M protein
MSAPMSKVIDTLWERLWAAGVTSPVTAIEQFSLLLLARRLDLENADRFDDRLFATFPRMSWRSIRSGPVDTVYKSLHRELIPFLEYALQSRHFDEAMKGAMFSVPNPALLSEFISAIDSLEFESHETEFAGEVFEALLRQLQVSGREAQVVTPPQLARAMVELLDPRSGELVCDPVVGTGGFLVEAFKTVSGKSGARPWGGDFVGFDYDPSMVRLAVMNLVLHGVEQPTVSYQNTLAPSFGLGEADVVVANPPFGSRLDAADLSIELGLKTNRGDVLFLELCRRLLTPRGRAAVVVPEGVLFSESGVHTEVRRRWLTKARVDAVISLPPSIFRPHTSVNTSILFATAGEPTGSVLFCPLDATDRGAGLEELGLLARAIRMRLGRQLSVDDPARGLAERFKSVSIDAIRNHDWKLAPAVFDDAAQPEVAEHDPLRLLSTIEGLESQLHGHLVGARQLLERFQ